jgi:transcriptional regulator with XRE-family HTH domain
MEQSKSETIVSTDKTRIAGMDYKVESGRRIVMLRERKGWKPQRLAEESGLLYKRIDHYEKGRRQIAPAEAVTLAKALGTKPAFLMALDESEVQITPTEEALIRNWRTLSERERMEFFRRLETAAMQNRDPVADIHATRAAGKVPKSKLKKRAGF